MKNFGLIKLLSTGHKYSPVKSQLITIRDTLLKKNLGNLDLNLNSLRSGTDKFFNGEYVEIGVGYTINDLLYFRAKHKFNKAIITDVNDILCLRLNCFCLLVDFRNYFHKVFHRNFSLICCGLLFGRMALRMYNIEYRVSAEIPKIDNALVFSNAVFEHIEPEKLDILMREIKLRLPRSICFGIIDANDHLNRTAPLDKQFTVSGRPNNFDVQFRGNGMLMSDWQRLFDTYFKDAELKIHDQNGLELQGIYSYWFIVEELDIK